jgi:hypothetical protein
MCPCSCSTPVQITLLVVKILLIQVRNRQVSNGTVEQVAAAFSSSMAPLIWKARLSNISAELVEASQDIILKTIELAISAISRLG